MHSPFRLRRKQSQKNSIEKIFSNGAGLISINRTCSARHMMKFTLALMGFLETMRMYVIRKMTAIDV